jgi:hypothetical protein
MENGMDHSAMSDEERIALHTEWKGLIEKMEKATFIDPQDMRRKEEITSLLMTNGQSNSIKFNFVRGRRSSKGLNTKGYNDHGGKTGL